MPSYGMNSDPKSTAHFTCLVYIYVQLRPAFMDCKFLVSFNYPAIYKLTLSLINQLALQQVSRHSYKTRWLKSMAKTLAILATA